MNIFNKVQLNYNLVYIFNYFELQTSESWAIHL